MLGDVDKEADASVVRHRPAGYKEAQVTPSPVASSTQRKAFLAFMAGGQALVKAQALVRMQTGLQLHKSAEELTEESERLKSQQAAASHQQQQGLQRMATNMQLFKNKQAAEEILSVSMRGEGLDRMDTFGLSDPFVEFYRRAGPAEIAAAATAAAVGSSSAAAASSSRRSSGGAGTDTVRSLGSGSAPGQDGWVLVATSDVQKNTLNPKWAPLLIKSAAFFHDGSAGAVACAPLIVAATVRDAQTAAAAAAAAASVAAGHHMLSSSSGRSSGSGDAAVTSPPLLLKCFDWNSNGDKDLIGVCQTDYVTLRRCKELKLDLMRPENKGSTLKKKGTLVLENCKAVQTRTESKDISATKAMAQSLAGSGGNRRGTHKRSSTRSKMEM
jgi:hypothetical protein